MQKKRNFRHSPVNVDPNQISDIYSNIYASLFFVKLFLLIDFSQNTA